MDDSKYPAKPILLVDDDVTVLSSLEITLKMGGFNNVMTCNDSRNVQDLLANTECSVILLDLYMPHIKGNALIPVIKEQYPHIPIVVVTGVNEVRIAVQCIKDGASDYLVKPVEKNNLLSVVRHALELVDAHNEIISLKEQFLSDDDKIPEAFSHIICKNQKMTSIIKYLNAIRMSRKPVLITGETGVGKDLFAQAIHNSSGLSGEYVAVNVGGLDDTMFTDTLFGHIKGSYTGANTGRKGLIEEARGGTLFLDEIGELSNSSQVKLLRLLQSGEYLPLGSDNFKISKARIICATNLNLHQEIESGRFRKDLYFRLQTHHIIIPSMRDRLDDLPLLVNHFLELSAKSLDKPVPTIPPQLIKLLSSYRFPGNVRELESLIHDAVSQHGSGVMSMDSFKETIFRDMPEESFSSTVDENGEDAAFAFPEFLPTLEKMEKMLIEEALQRFDDNQTLAAQVLGISRHTLMRRLRKWQSE